MVIGIEAERANVREKTGVEHYAKQLILHLAEIDSENEYCLYLRTAPERWFLDLPKNFKLKVLPFPVFWTQLRLSWEMLMHPVDVLFVPASAMPFFHPKNSVCTIHDLAWDFFPETYTTFIRWYSKFVTWFVVRFSQRLIAVSLSTKNDLIKKYGCDPEKIFVVHHGFQLPQTEAFQSIDLPEKYILFLSTLQPRKNLLGLIEAFKKLKLEFPDLPHKLLVVGKPGWKYEAMLESIESHNGFIVYLNHISEIHKGEILKRADLLVLPSFYEGFGMQILEAFAAGVPVAASNVSSLPEVAGDAAIYFNPNNPAEIAQAVKMVLFDKSLADRLRESGRRQLEKFSWEKCAKETLAVLEA